MTIRRAFEQQRDLFKSRRGRDNALARLEKARKLYLEQARWHAEQIAALSNDGTVTTDDVWKACPPPMDMDPRVMGAVFRTKEWEAVGFVASVRPDCHARPIRVFRLKRPIV